MKNTKILIVLLFSINLSAQGVQNQQSPYK